MNKLRLLSEEDPNKRVDLLSKIMFFILVFSAIPMLWFGLSREAAKTMTTFPAHNISAFVKGETVFFAKTGEEVYVVDIDWNNTTIRFEDGRTDEVNSSALTIVRPK